MKIYMLGTIANPWKSNPPFATCSMGCPNGEFVVGSYRPSWWHWDDRCPKCGLNIATTRLVPWKMEWEEGSDCIGDFAGYSAPCWYPIAQRKVIDFFHNNNFFINTFETVFKAVPPPSPRSRKPRYPIVFTTPYEGPPFWGIAPRYGVHLNEEKSQKTRLSSCSVCGCLQYERNLWDSWRKIVVDEEEWNGLKLFGVFELGSMLTPGDGVYISEEGYDELMKQGFSNLRCREAGRIEKAGHGKMKPYREQADYDFWKPDEYVPPPPKEKPIKQTKKKI